jgi:propionyl-CoA carboxylase alpha chain
VHPGYGFLSENASFCRGAGKAEGIAFIGPKVKAIEAMGDKITSKKIAAEAGVSTVPGHMGLIDDAAHAAKIAAEIGYPVMIKASPAAAARACASPGTTPRRARASPARNRRPQVSFGDDRIFIEKFIEEPRHIEIQVLADSTATRSIWASANARSSGATRRSSRKRRRPSSMRKPARRWASRRWRWPRPWTTIAGTVEFIVDKHRNFYFLEMNTRLQVEHPVTELITGIDLVEQMIRVAAGEKLSFTQDDVKLNGWAVESRLYAEDPYRNFLPSIGRLTRYRPPQEGTRQRRRHRPQRHRRLRGRRDLDVLRPDDRQAVHLGADPATRRSTRWRMR